MFQGHTCHPQHSRSPNTSEANINPLTQNIWLGRPMGPPQLSQPPQPVEIDPVSYPRVSGSYASWEGTPYPGGYVGEPGIPVSTSTGHNKPGIALVDNGTRNGPQDSLASWYNGNDGPWAPKGAFPEVAQDDRIHAKGYSTLRTYGYGLSPVAHLKAGNPSDHGSVHFGIPPSDSGYGTGISLDSSSVRGSDVLDNSQGTRTHSGRIRRVHQYPERRSSIRESYRTESLLYYSPSGLSHRCSTCHKFVKTKSELKKHHLRHTKPFHCINTSCNWSEGFSTVNDLNRHKQSKHPGDFSCEIRSKTYHCLVAGCKSKDKIWPRLDNFRSHLKRMHRLSEEDMDKFAQRGKIEQQPREILLPQGSSSESLGRRNQDIPSGIGSDEFSELSYSCDQPQWNNVSPSPLDRQAEIMNPSLETADVQTLAPPNAGSLIGSEDDMGKSGSLRGSGALWEPDTGNGCLESFKELTSADTTDESIIMSITESIGSSVVTLKSTDTLDRGKTLNPKNACPIDPCLRDAIITAVFSNVTPIQEDGSHPEIKSQSPVGSPDMDHDCQILPCPEASGAALSRKTVTSGDYSDDQGPCLKASFTSKLDKRDLAEENAKIQNILQAIKDAGYVLKKENSSQSGNLGLGAHKKLDPVGCSRCEFKGRPCELKKHMKRHTRPYSCTFNKCSKMFGSKNDWKRHEISQHYQHETWKCDEKANGASCTKVFFRPDLARAHLSEIHKVIDPAIIERKIDLRRMGANFQSRYWCGFCKKTIDLTQKGMDAFTERFDHIDDHYMGKNGQVEQTIVQWKALDSDDDSVQQNVFSNKDRSPKKKDETSEDYSPSSGDNSSSSPDNSTLPPSLDEGPAELKRKRADSEDRRGRAKQSRTSIQEIRIECCQCGLNFNPKIDIACTNDEHTFCSRCPREKIVVQKEALT